MVRRVTMAAVLAGVAGLASANDVLQVDVNGLSARSSGAFSETFTGSLSVFSSVANPDLDGDAEILDVLIDGTNQNTGGAAFGDFSFEMTLTFANGTLNAGFLQVRVDENGSENTYSAMVSPGSGGSILEIAPGQFIIGGLTFDGMFANPAGTFLGVDITPWGSRQPVPGRFSQIEFSPDGRNEDRDTDVDVFVLIPMPGAAGLAGLGLAGLALRRRR